MIGAALALTLLLATPPTPGFGYGDYQPAGLKAFAEQTLRDHPEMFVRHEGRDTATHHPMQKLRVRAVVRGRVRALAGFKGMIIEGWLRQNWPPMAGGTFAHEILVQDGGKEFWLPIQEPLIPFFEREAPWGSTVELYVAFTGSTHEELIFLVNEFRAVEPSK